MRNLSRREILKASVLGAVALVLPKLPVDPARLFTSARATGGPVGPLGPYIVGESGPELIVPAVDGQIWYHRGREAFQVFGNGRWLDLSVEKLDG